jgi:hypothetical protein
MESHDSHPQIDREELVAFIVDKSQRLSADKDFIVAMDRLIQFAKHMREREREAQVLHALRFMWCACLVTSPAESRICAC